MTYLSSSIFMTKSGSVNMDGEIATLVNTAVRLICSFHELWSTSAENGDDGKFQKQTIHQ